MEHDIFDEVEHWLLFIKECDKGGRKIASDDVLMALEIALKNAIINYKHLKSEYNDIKHFH